MTFAKVDVSYSENASEGLVMPAGTQLSSDFKQLNMLGTHPAHDLLSWNQKRQ